MGCLQSCCLPLDERREERRPLRETERSSYAAAEALPRASTQLDSYSPGNYNFNLEEQVCHGREVSSTPIADTLRYKATPTSTKVYETEVSHLITGLKNTPKKPPAEKSVPSHLPANLRNYENCRDTSYGYTAAGKPSYAVNLKGEDEGHTVRARSSMLRRDEDSDRVWSVSFLSCELQEEYNEARKAAEKHALKRGRLFEKSQKAYRSGCGAEAKELAERGHEQSALMEAANKRAAEIILGSQDLVDGDEINLHGLLVKEAIEATREFVLSCVGRLDVVKVITGQGRHSYSSKGPVVKFAVMQLCENENWEYDIHANNHGCLIVEIPATAPPRDPRKM